MKETNDTETKDKFIDQWKKNNISKLQLACVWNPSIGEAMKVSQSKAWGLY